MKQLTKRSALQATGGYLVFVAAVGILFSLPCISVPKQNENIVIIQKREQKSLWGIVKDANEAIIIAVTVELYTHSEETYDWRNPRYQKVRQKRLARYLPGKDGQFNFTGIKPGDYELRLSAPGFKTLSYCIKFRPDSLTGSKKRMDISLQMAT